MPKLPFRNVLVNYKRTNSETDKANILLIYFHSISLIVI